MTPSWDALAAPFAPSNVAWRVVRLSEDGLSAQVRPQLPPSVVRARFDSVLDVGGWSHDYRALGDRGIICSVSVGSVRRSAVAAYSDLQTLAETAEDAFVAAAALFGVQTTVLLAELPWVEYDAETKQILYEPDADAPESAPEVPASFEADEVRTAPDPDLEPATTPVPAKSAGQQAIDKLVDRLKAEGRGLEAAKLLNAYGGYGSDPQTARELYAKLRGLLLGTP